MESRKVKPFLKWAGGKTWLLEKLRPMIPKKMGRYFEPFLGGGSLFFDVKPRIPILNDSNNDLILTYRQVKLTLPGVLRALKSFKSNKKSYYRIRKQEPKSHIERAARFIFLNQTCFNGIYRVNKEGVFNVPYGTGRTDFFNEENLKLCSQVLKNAQLTSQDFTVAFDSAEKGDFVFIDPPYTVMHSDNGFIEYNKKLFSWEDQATLAELVSGLDRRGIKYVLTNANHQSITNLYQHIGHTFVVNRNSTVSAKMKARKMISELIISNCI